MIKSIAILLLGVATLLGAISNERLRQTVEKQQVRIEDLEATQVTTFKLFTDKANSLQDKLESRIGELESEVDTLHFLLGGKNAVHQK